MKLRKIFYLSAIAILFSVFISSCSQTSNKTAENEETTEVSLEKADETTATDTAKKCGEGKCGDAKEETDTTKKCGEGKCGA